MKTHLFVLFHLLTFGVIAQCPKYIDLHSQSDVDQFIIDFPECDSIQGRIRIFGHQDDTIKNLQGLSNLTHINTIDVLGSLIKDFQDLSNINSINNLYVSSTSSALESFRGLEHLESFVELSLGGNLKDLSHISEVSNINKLRIYRLANIKEIDGFNSLSKIDELTIAQCDTLERISGFKNLDTIGSLALEELRVTDYGGLQNLKSVNDLYIDELVGVDYIEEFNDLNVQCSLSISETSLLGIPLFSGTTQMKYGITIERNSRLENLNTLNNLTSISEYGNIFITGNSFDKLNGFNSLRVISGNLYMTGNVNLRVIDGFQNLSAITYITEIVNPSFQLLDNTNLEEINGFQNLTDVHTVEITDNLALSSCVLDGICELLQNASVVEIRDNGEGCSSVADFSVNCLLSTICGEVFYDMNRNGIRDDEESLLANIRVDIDSLGESRFTNREGFFKFYVPYGSHSISTFTNRCLSNLGDSLGYRVEVDIESDSIYLTIPLERYEEDTDSISLQMYTPRTRCNSRVPFYVNLSNVGCSKLDSGIIKVVLQDYVFLDSIDQEYTVFNDTIYLEHGTLLPEEKYSAILSVFIPGVEFVGDTIQTQIFSETFGGTVDTVFHQSEIRCSYDPNDKMSFSEKTANDGTKYNLGDKDLEYMIRFQNVGNDTAYNVIVSDKLSDHLDPNTIRIRSSSHNYRAEINARDSLVFYFDNIYLPDSNTNLSASNGHIVFTIQAKIETAHLTEVNNNAAIYFDFNPPVITNTTSNIIVDYFDFDQDGFHFWEECNDKDASVNPAAEEIANNEIDENCDGELGIVDNDMDGFNSEEDCNDENAEINPDAEEIADNDVDENCDGIIESTTSIDNAEKTDITFYPNPASDEIVFKKAENLWDEEIRVKILNVTGLIVKQESIIGSHKMNISSLEPGVYYIETTNSKNSILFISKLVVL